MTVLLYVVGAVFALLAAVLLFGRARAGTWLAGTVFSIGVAWAILATSWWPLLGAVVLWRLLRHLGMDPRWISPVRRRLRQVEPEATFVWIVEFMIEEATAIAEPLGSRLAAALDPSEPLLVVSHRMRLRRTRALAVALVVDRLFREAGLPPDTVMETLARDSAFRRWGWRTACDVWRIVGATRGAADLDREQVAGLSLLPLFSTALDGAPEGTPILEGLLRTGMLPGDAHRVVAVLADYAEQVVRWIEADAVLTKAASVFGTWVRSDPQQLAGAVNEWRTSRPF